MNGLNGLIEPGTSVLVLAPHPDDEVFGCGGTIALLTREGTAVQTVICTRGEAIEREPFTVPPGPEVNLGALRTRESELAAAVLGCAPPLHLGLPDGGLLGVQERLVASLDECVLERKPSLLLAPWPGEQHGDHVAAAWAATGCALNRGINLAFFEVNTPLCPNAWVDIEPVLETKRRALMNYEYSFYGKPHVFWEAVRGLNAYRSFYFIRTGWHEAFFVPRRPTDKETLGRWASSPLRWEHGCGSVLPPQK